ATRISGAADHLPGTDLVKRAQQLAVPVQERGLRLWPDRLLDLRGESLEVQRDLFDARDRVLLQHKHTLGRMPVAICAGQHLASDVAPWKLDQAGGCESRPGKRRSAR